MNHLPSLPIFLSSDNFLFVKIIPIPNPSNWSKYLRDHIQFEGADENLKKQTIFNVCVLFDTAVILNCGQCHRSCIIGLPVDKQNFVICQHTFKTVLKEYYHHAKFDIYYIYSIQENCNVEHFAMPSQPKSLTLIIIMTHIFHVSQRQKTSVDLHSVFILC